MNCLKCPKRSVCRVICEAVEAVLRASGIYGVDYIRPYMAPGKRQEGLSKFREIPFSSYGFDKDGERPENEEEIP
jgi:hypothetical protein